VIIRAARSGNQAQRARGLHAPRRGRTRFECDNVRPMPRMIQVRNVPDEVHRTLTTRAAGAGMSLSDYIKRDLVQAASKPSIEEIDARVRARGPSRVRAQTIVETLRDVRGG
jgi:antitoxin FitA